MAAHVSALQEWYGKILSRRVDLVGDYAGNELFIVEGDSLLLNCFSDSRIDFQHGFQLLHAVYCVEQFLANLKRRKCNFCLVFFDSHEALCVPANCPHRFRSRYLLARYAIIRHLRQNLSAESGILVKTFASPFEPTFAKYINDAGVYFAMCHDGSLAVEGDTEAEVAYPLDGGDAEDSEDESTESSYGGSDESEAEWEAAARSDRNENKIQSRDTTTIDDDLDLMLNNNADGELIDDDTVTEQASTLLVGTNSTLNAESTLVGDLEGWALDDVPMTVGARRRVAFRGLINWFITHGYNVALINEVTFADTKVFSVVLEGSSHRTMKLPEEWLQSLTDPIADIPPPATGAGIDALLQALSTSPLELSDRDVLALAAVITLLQSQEISPEQAATLVLSNVMLDFVPLSERSFEKRGKRSQLATLQKYIESLVGLTNYQPLQAKLASKMSCCADMVDGRLFLNMEGPTIPYYSTQQPISSRFEELCSFIKPLVGIEHSLPQTKSTKSKGVRAPQSRPAVLPFQNAVFDKHLTPVRLQIDLVDPPMSKTKSRVFRELSHWHNYKRPITRKGEPAKLNKWALKRNQRFMAEMITYAASLTNASGKVLEPEIIVAGGQSAKESTSAAREKKAAAEGKSSKAPPQHQKSGKKPAQQGKKSNKELALEAAAAVKAAKSSAKAHTVMDTWDKVRKELEAEKDYELQFVKTQKHLSSLSAENAAILGAEIQLFSIKALAGVWQTACDSGSTSKRLSVVAAIWKLCLQLQQVTTGISEAMVRELHSLTTQLGLPTPQIKATTSESRKLPFSLALTKGATPFKSKGSALKSGGSYAVDMPSKIFQLQHCGPYFDRSIDAEPDSRVPFQPDGWQRKVLDAIDDNKSLFVVAPTSAGKTFISFYAMRQVLRASDEGIVVYVAPTKALVNQIAAEVQARFSKSFKADARSVWGIHTRDYRINNPTGCQVLVTVPHILQIMLLAPAHAEKKSSWAYRIKRIIFDEVHCIGQSDDGLIWEQLLLQASCPIIALSATVGNPKKFGEWLGSTQRACGNELVTVEHHTRYSDLRKFVYNAPKGFVFEGLPQRPLIHPPGLDDSDAFSFVHPVAGLVNRSRGMPNDLNLEARDCYLLWEAMSKHQTSDFPVPNALGPDKCLPEIVRKIDALQWETKVKELLRTWMIAASSPYDKVVAELQPKIIDRRLESQKPVEQDTQEHSTTATSEGRLRNTTLPLLADLHAKDALPAILFSFDRTMCEHMAKEVVEGLEASEAKWKESDGSWKKTIAEFEKYQDQERLASKAKVPKNTKKKGARGDDDGDTESKADRQRGAASADGSKWATFDPKAPVDGFSFADNKKVAGSDLQEYQAQLRGRGVEEWLVTALSRGIGIHHAGMNRKYRQVVEILFRKGFLHAVIATGTLALGINMPCKTVVFSGDSVFLTALNYRQCAGRAGRRGFDVLGNVVFQELHYSKVCMLLSSRLPDLNGHFPITTALVLRLATLLHETKHSEFAVRSIDAILSQPRFVLGGSEEKSAVLHHLRFSIEYLRRQNLLGQDGAPLNFAGLASHLYYTEASTWAFHALMKEGYFHKLAKNIHQKPKQTGLTLMLVLAHIFGRYKCRRADMEFYKQYVKHSPSVVFLPDLPPDARKVLIKHNRETLDIFQTYVRTYAEQHLTDNDDNTLPLTGTQIGPKPEDNAKTSAPALQPTIVRSHFVALSGHKDESIHSISDLCTSVRSGVFLEEAVIPYLPVWDKYEEAPLNAYLYDFYKHGDVSALSRANRIKEGDVWFVLNDFSLVLATVVTSLMNYMKLSPAADADMTDLMGTGEALEEQRDDVANDKEEAKKATLNQAATPAAPNRAKARVAESWVTAADAMDLDNTPAKSMDSKVNDPDSLEAETDGSGLMNVLLAFQHVKTEFDAKFKAIWA
ncbi:P-loop containing nucleoside triphosphate hydrolase protein [Xylariaceae sp. AK1471]|nr:P-loop containing nucleoside triphosphate hydrolase protein [Xylariaceae sp. AK1471]